MIVRGFVLALAGIIAAAAQQQQPYPGAADIDRAVNEAVARGEMPGAVVEIGQPGTVLFRKAYGARALEPAREAMTEDTIFDVASLTKVIATTSAMMKLFETGRVRLNDPVTAYLPEFQGGKSEITVRQLMTHFSGLRPDVDLKPAWSGYETGVKLALVDKPVARPGERFIYSDINFILLGEMVRRLSGKPLPEFVEQTVFAPLGMQDTRFQPPTAWRPRIAPTEKEPGMTAPLRGVVHDPTTRFMGGIAGHAGLFSTAADLGRFAQMMLRQGTAPEAGAGRRLFEAATIAKFTEPQTPMDQPLLRALGWDMDSRYSANRGELFPFGSYGHTGFTGTSIWIDPSSHTYVVILANSVHPMRRPPINSLRSRVATIAAAHAGIERPGGMLLTTYNETTAGLRRAVARNGDVLTGIDVLMAENFARLRGKRVGLITNHTGLARTGERNVDVMVRAGVNVVALLSPEHGITGTEDREDVASSVDKASGVRVVSLYDGPNRRPSAQLLSTMDVLIFDIQDVGARFYTYMCTLLGTLEEAGKSGAITVMVLDRPNPITGNRVEGALLDKELESFIGCYHLPLRHGMTLGEIATMGNAEQKWNARLEVVKMKGWQRGDWLDSTNAEWLNPSPNIRSLSAATVYPAVAMLEYSKNYSVGRGTDSPFEHIGAPWINGRQLAAYLNSRAIAGVRFYPTRFKPESGNLAGQTVQGVRLMVTNREELSLGLLGAEITGALLKLYPGKIDLETNRKLIGNRQTISRHQAGMDPREIHRLETEALEGFLERRRRFLLY